MGRKFQAGFNCETVGGKRRVLALIYPVFAGFMDRCCKEGSPLVFQLLEHLKVTILEVGFRHLLGFLERKTLLLVLMGER